MCKWVADFSDVETVLGAVRPTKIMASSSHIEVDTRLEELWKKFSLMDEEEEGITISKEQGKKDTGEEEFRWCLVGRLHTDRFFNVAVMKLLATYERIACEGLGGKSISIPILS